jgi:hypothetical protein
MLNSLENPGIPLLYLIGQSIYKKENAMEQFLSRHKEHISGVLSGFDRLLFRGTLRSISYLEGMAKFLSYNHILLKDFGSFVEKQSCHLKEHAKAYAHHLRRPYLYLQSSSTSKEQIAKDIMQRDNVTKGLICVLSCVEPCQTFSIRKDKESKTIMLVSALRKCLHFYFYFVDREFGFMHIRLQSWFPFPMQVCINGREWLARKMDKAGICYQRRENCFIYISDIKRAQKMADDAVKRNWRKLLDRFADVFNPILQKLDIHGYYWTIREAEYATDIMFKDANYLKRLYKNLVHHAIENFSSEDIMRFLQRRSNILFKGEVVSDIRKRSEGTRIKHWVEENSIKMYDKQAYVLRIETTINNPGRFKVYRDAIRNGKKTKAWIPMRKGIADIYRRVELSYAANGRYLDALSVIGDKKPSFRYFDAVSKPVNKNKRRYRPLRPIAPDEATAFVSILHGEFMIRGFRNADLRTLLFCKPTCKKEKYRQMGKTSRIIRLFRAHGLLKKVSKTRLYRITKKGQLLMSTALYFRNSEMALLGNIA